VPVPKRQKAVQAAAPAAVPQPPSQGNRGQVTARSSDDRGDHGGGDGDGRGGENQSSGAGGTSDRRAVAGTGQVQSAHVTKCAVCLVL